MIDLVSRSEWGARSPHGSYSALTSTRGVKVHYTGGHVDVATLSDHSRCVAAVKGIQSGHIDGNGWIDIGYTAAVCAHRKVFVGRGLHHLPAANGEGLNSGHYAVLGLVGTSGVVAPPEAMLHGIRDAIEWLRADGGAGTEIKGHRDGYATDCPGAALYAWVKLGAPRPDGSTATPAPTLSWMEKLMKDLPLVAAGDDNFDVKTVRGCLNARGRLPASAYAHNPAGLEGWLESTHCDPNLVELIRVFQRVSGLDDDGIVGPMTWPKLLRV